MLDITVYRRHSKDCRYATDRFSSRCSCKIWLQYQDEPGHQVKVSARTRDWEAAMAIARAKATGQALPPSATAAVAAADKQQATIEAVARDYYDTGLTQGRFAHSRATKIRRMLFEITKRTTKKAKKFNDATKAAMTPPMAVWFALAGITLMRDVTNDSLKGPSLKRWWKTWKFKRSSDGTPGPSLKIHTDLVNAFLRWAHDEGYTAIRLRLPQVTVSPKARREVQKQPFSPHEMETILGTIDKMEGWDEDKKKRIRGFILLQRWSGLAILDASIRAHADIDSQDRVFLYREKTDTEVRVKLPPDVVEFLRTVPNDNPKYIFWNGKCKPVTVKNNFDGHLRQLFHAAGIVNGTSHRFRHTFAVENLLAGMSMEKVSKLLGHKNVATTERYYNAFTADRHAALEDETEALWAVQEKRHRKRLATAATVQ